MKSWIWVKLSIFLLVAVLGISVFSRIFTSPDVKWLLFFAGTSYLFLLLLLYLVLSPLTRAFDFLSQLLNSEKKVLRLHLNSLAHTNNFYLKSLRVPLISLLSPKKQTQVQDPSTESFLNIVDSVIKRAHYVYPHLKIDTDLMSDIKLPIFTEPLLQSLWELVKNAAQAQLGSEAGLLIRTFLKDNKWFCCEVEDQGPGLPSSVLLKASDLYFTTKANSTGLGLPFVQSTLDRIGGVMELHSEKGLKVCIFIPLDYLSHIQNLQAKEREACL